MKRAKVIFLFFGIMSICFFSACSNRNKLSPQQALIGHWQEKDGNIDYYFTSDRVTRVKKGMPPESYGYRLKKPASDDALVIQYIPDETKVTVDGQQVPIIPTVGEVLTFEKNRTSLTATIDLPQNMKSGFVVKTIWKYQDNKQQP